MDLYFDAIKNSIIQRRKKDRSYLFMNFNTNKDENIY